MSKNSSAKHYQDNKERQPTKDPRRTYQVLSKEQKEKRDNIFVNDRKICQKMKNKICLSIEKSIIK